MPNRVSGEIFTYQQLKEKAEREIARLEKGELSIDNDVLDHALNAAFSIYHLLEWRHQEDNSNVKKKASKLLEEANSESLNLLHDIVTYTKHASVSKPQYQAELNVRVSAANVGFLLKEDGGYLLKEDGGRLMKDDSRLAVKFDNKEALEVLKKALLEFE